MAYKAVHTGPNSQLGGCQDGFLRVLYLQHKQAPDGLSGAHCLKHMALAAYLPPLDLFLHSNAHADACPQRDGYSSGLHIRTVRVK